MIDAVDPLLYQCYTSVQCLECANKLLLLFTIIAIIHIIIITNTITATSQFSEHVLIEQLGLLKTYAPSVLATSSAGMEESTCLCRIKEKTTTATAGCSSNIYS